MLILISAVLARPMERNTTFHQMVWHAHKNGHLADGRWQATEVIHPPCI